MPAKTAAKAKSTKPTRATKTGASKVTGGRRSARLTLSHEDHERAAYFNWIDRGSPIGDDQCDWFEVTKK
ncbi:MAG: hypothetical protein OEV42_05890 [Deltaproteobacteria bacterium]|nr:hypothetical protein [Deltaproteobacteria bacterium]